MCKCVNNLLTIVFPILVFTSCSSTNNKPLSIEFSADSATIVFSDIDRPGLLKLNELPKGDSTLNNLISVLITPGEDDSTTMEAPIDGKINVTDSNVVFHPSTPFQRGKSYLVITHLNAEFGNVAALAKGEGSYHVRPVQKILQR